MVKRLSQIGSSVLLVLLLAVISVSHQSCIGGDKDPYELGPYEWGDFWLPYIYFKEGSWWVYQSIDGRDTLYDTVRVVTSDLQMVRYDDEKPRNWKVTKEWFRYTMTSTVQGDVIHETPHSGILDATDTMYYGEFVMIRTVWDEGTIRPFFRYTVNYQRTGTGSTSTEFEGFKSSIQVGDVTYVDVAQFSITDDASWNWDGDPATYYWSKGKGLIKRENLKTGEEWHLIDYRVTQ